jgi:hypothetical protein
MTPFIQEKLRQFDEEFMQYAEENENTLIDPDTDGNNVKSFLATALTEMVGESHADWKKEMMGKIAVMEEIGVIIPILSPDSTAKEIEDSAIHATLDEVKRLLD